MTDSCCSATATATSTATATWTGARPTRIDNGMVGTIRAVHGDDSIDIQLANGRNLRIAGAYVRAGFIDHGYATTIHKAQGLTCDQVFLVGPNGLYREAVYVAMSRARHGAFVYATSTQIAELVERSHTTGIPLEVEHVDELDHDVRRAVETSRAKMLALTHDRLLQPIANVAAQHHLDWLWDRHVRCRSVAADTRPRRLHRPHRRPIRLELARAHRHYLSVGSRVNAADWDNLGTVLAVLDRTGTALVEFISSDGRRHTRKTLEWADLRPVDQPERVDLTDDATAYFTLAQAAIDEHAADWHTQLRRRGLHPDELHIIPAAIAVRRQRLAHTLAGDPPRGSPGGTGPDPPTPPAPKYGTTKSPSSPPGATPTTSTPTPPATAPDPDDERHATRWAEHLDRSLATRHWLHHHSPTLPPPDPQPVDIAAVRHRLTELDALLATAPPDQTRIIDAIRTGDLTPADIHQALLDAAHTQDARRHWILEHWPHVVEHAELTRISNTHDPLAHWPQPHSPEVLDRHQQLRTISTDTPENATLHQLDERMANAHPLATQRRLQHHRAALTARLNQLDAVTPHADDTQAALLATHRQRLIARLADIDHQTARHARQRQLVESRTATPPPPRRHHPPRQPPRPPRHHHRTAMGLQRHQ